MENNGKLETRLWGSADTLRAGSNLASNEYFIPVMGLIFLRHAYLRFLKAGDEIIPGLPSRGGKPKIKVRRALLYYSLKRLGLESDPSARRPQDQQIVLINADEIRGGCP